MFQLQALRMVFLLIKEYFKADEKKRAKMLGIRTVLFFFIAAFIVCLMVTMYLEEQAKQNLTIHRTIIEKNKLLVDETGKLENKVGSLSKQHAECLSTDKQP